MSQSSNMALRGQKTISREELLALKQEMNAKALTKEESVQEGFWPETLYLPS